MKLVGMRDQNDDGYRKGRDVMLVGKVLVNGDECVELRGLQRHQCAVLYATPSHLDRGLYDVCRQSSAKSAGYRLVKQ